MKLVLCLCVCVCLGFWIWNLFSQFVWDFSIDKTDTADAMRCDALCTNFEFYDETGELVEWPLNLPKKNMISVYSVSERCLYRSGSNVAAATISLSVFVQRR